MVNAQGQLVGMIGKLIASKSTNTRLNYAVPVDQLKGFVEGKEAASLQMREMVLDLAEEAIVMAVGNACPEKTKPEEWTERSCG